jgi:hypothetical protein
MGNPGGITAATFMASGNGAVWRLHMSEWSNVQRAFGNFDAATTGSSTSGTTLALSAGPLLSPGDLVLAAWSQLIGVAGAVTFTTPSGFTRLADNQTDVTTTHLDIEYLLAPAQGSTVNPTLTSSGTTTSAAGMLIALLPAPGTVELTDYIAYGSLSVKKNTFDFMLIDPPVDLSYGNKAVTPSLGDPVTLTEPLWSGRVVDITFDTINQRASLIDPHRYVKVTAINSDPDPGGVAPGDLTDDADFPISGGHLLLEDGSGALLLDDGSISLESGFGDILLEDGSGHLLTQDSTGKGYLLLEESTFAYQSVSIRQSQSQDGSTTYYGTATTYQGGYKAGQAIFVYSANLQTFVGTFIITNVTTTWQRGGDNPVPIYLIEFGDEQQTMQSAGGGVLTKQGSEAVTQPGVVMTGGTYGFAELSSTQGSITAITDITGLSLTIAPASGRRYSIKTVVPLSSTVATDIVAIAIVNELGTVIAGGQDICVSAGGFIDLAAEKVLVADGATHTYTVRAERAVGTGTITMQAGQTQVGITHYAHLLIEDIGT